MRMNIRKIAHGVSTVARAVTNPLPRIPSSIAPPKSPSPKSSAGPKVPRQPKPKPNSRQQALTEEQRILKRSVRPRSKVKVRVFK